MNLHPDRIVRIATQALLDRALGLGRYAEDEREVLLPYRRALELLRDRLLRGLVLGEQQDAARVHVDAVHRSDARVDVAAPRQAELLADRLLGEGIVLVPGSYFGPAGTGYLRLALVPSLAGCERAAARLGHLLR